MTKPKAKAETKAKAEPSRKTFKLVRGGKHGRHEAGKFVSYKRGDEIKLTAKEAEFLADRVEPAN